MQSGDTIAGQAVLQALGDRVGEAVLVLHQVGPVDRQVRVVDALASDTAIEVVLSVTAQLLTLEVIDHGAGIEPTQREQIFLPSYRSDPSRVRDLHSGSGLGFAVTRQIAHEHDGSLTVDETPGGGATFTLRLPVAVREAASGAE